jgi:FkbM family methyltransferase
MSRRVLTLCFILFPFAIQSVKGIRKLDRRRHGITREMSHSFLSASYIDQTYSFACTGNQSMRQSLFLNREQSSCPSGEPWAAFHSVGFACDAPVLVNVGANKGYAIAAFLALWRPDLKVTPASLGEALLKKYPDMPYYCGVCGDCREVPLPSLLPEELRRKCAAHASIFAIEPVASNVELLDGVLKPLIYEKYSGNERDHADISFHVLNAAVTGQRGLGTIGFTGDCHRGSEVCSISSSSQHKVPAMTMDEWFEQQIFHHVDVMVIDAEGHDPDILDGAQDMLESQAVKVLVFEYHHIGSWETRDLSPVVERLDGFGYDCFLLQQKATAIRLTKCWSKEYEKKGWSNVMCVLRKEAPLLAAMNSFVPLRLPD